MGLKCLFGHKWNGCKCVKCDAIRDKGHNWLIIEGKCIEKCSICDKERSALKELLEEAEDVLIFQINVLFIDCGLSLSGAGINNFFSIMQKYIDRSVMDLKEILLLSQYCIDSAAYLITPAAADRITGTRSAYSGCSKDELASISELYSKLSQKLPQLFSDQLTTTHVPENIKKTNILDEYRAGLSYLDECGAFDEAKFRKFNHIIGNRFSEADITNQLKNAELMIKGMEDLKQLLRSNMVEGISTFEELKRNGIDLSKYDV